MTDDPTTQPREGIDRPVTIGLIVDVFDVLERYGYRRPASAPNGSEDEFNRATGAAAGAVAALVCAYEGRQR